MAVTFGAVGTRFAGGTNAATPIAIAYPTGITAGQMLLLFVTVKVNTITVTTPSGWNLLLDISGGTGASALDAGTTRTYVFWREATGLETGTVSVAFSATPTGHTGYIVRYTKGAGTAWATPTAVGGADVVHGTAWAATGSANLSVTTGDLVVIGNGNDTDATTAYTTPTLTATGATITTPTVRLAQGGSASSNDCGCNLYDAPVTAGTSSAAPSHTLAAGPSACGETAFVRLRETAAAIDLTVDAASQAQVADQVTLTQTHDLTVNAAVQPQVADQVTVAPPGTDLTVNAAVQAQAADTVTLTQAHSLTVNAATQAHLADQATLTQVQALTTAAATQVQVADAVTLTQVHALSVNAAGQAQVADSVALTQAQAVTVAAAVQAQVADQVTLGQVHSLTVGDAVQVQVADTVALAGGASIVVADAVQAQAAQSVALSQVHVLTAADATQDHVASTVSLSQVHGLTVNGATQVQAANTVTLTAGGPEVAEAIPLVVADAIQAQAADHVTLTSEPGVTMPLNTYELPLARLLLECLQDAATIDHPNPPEHFSLRLGEVAMDISQYEDLCCEGLAYVKINSVYPSDDFPAPNEQYTVCANQWAADLEMGILRCSPVGDERFIPTDADWTAAAEQVAHDAAAMRLALARFRDRMEPGNPWLARNWAPIDPQGGCSGGTQVVTVAFIQSYC